MSARLLLISSDQAVGKSVRAAIDRVTSLIEIDHLRDGDDDIGEKYRPDGILIDSNVRNGVQTAFERIADAKRKFPKVPVIVLGNEMSAQLVLAALRAGADDFLDRDAGADQMRQAIQGCLSKVGESERPSRAKIAAILSALPSEQDQDFALNLALRAAKRSPDEMTLYIDLSVPATQAGIALGVELDFGVSHAIREVARVDKALLESALARDPNSGLYVMPLCTDFGADTPPLEAASFSALLQVLRGICGVIVINYGLFSRQKALLEMIQPGARFFVCCNQRLPSVRGANDLLRWFSENALGVPEIVVHELAPGHTPSPADIRNALKIADSIDLREDWDELAESVNQGKPLAFSTGKYGRGIDACLARLGIAPEAEPSFATRLRGWMRFGIPAEAS